MGNSLENCCQQLALNDIESSDTESSDTESSDTKSSDTKSSDTEFSDTESEDSVNHIDETNNNDKKRGYKRKAKKSELKKSKSFCDDEESKIKETQHTIRSLRKQNEFLKKQNEEFISNYGSFFASPPSITSSKSVDNARNWQNSFIATSQMGSQSYSNLYGKDMNHIISGPPMSPLISPLPSEDTTYKFVAQNLKERGSGRRRYRSDGNIAILDVIIDDGNIWNTHFDGKCNQIQDCIAIQRMRRALKWYGTFNGDADKIWKKIQDIKYGSNLITDYQHIMNYHLNNMDRMRMEKEKIMIYEEINKIVSKCDIELCEGYKRKKRDLDKEQSGDHIPFYVSYMDKIHCYFMHYI